MARESNWVICTLEMWCLSNTTTTKGCTYGVFHGLSQQRSLSHYAWISKNPQENVTVNNSHTSAGVIYCPASDPYFSESPVDMLSHDQRNHICVEFVVRPAISLLKLVQNQVEVKVEYDMCPNASLWTRGKQCGKEKLLPYFMIQKAVHDWTSCICILKQSQEK